MRKSRMIQRIEAARLRSGPRSTLRMDDLIRLVGQQTAVALARAYGGSRIPHVLPWLQQLRIRAVIARAAQGYKVRALSQWFHLSPITIRGILRAHRRRCGDGAASSRARVEVL